MSTGNKTTGSSRLPKLVRTSSLASRCPRAAAQAAAQLEIIVTDPGAQRSPIAIVPFAGEAAVGHAASPPIVRADLERSGLFRGVEVPPLSPAPTENTPVNYGEWRSRLADAVVLGSVVTRRRRPLRGALPRLRHRQAGAARRRSPTSSPRTTRARRRTASPTSSTRRSPARRACSRPRSPTWCAAAPPSSCRSPTPTASARNTSCAPTSRSSRRCGRPRAGASPTSRSSRRSRWSTCTTSRTASARWSASFRGSNSAPAWSPDGKTPGGGAVGGRRLADLPAQRRRQRRAPAHQQLRLDRHRAALLARRQVDLLHLRPRRQPAGLPHARHRRRAAARHLRGQL